MWRFGANVLLLALPLGAAPLCISGNNLQSYIALGSGGCMDGSFLVKDFLFAVASSGGGDVPIAPTNITVSTDIGGSSFGLTMGSTGFSVTGSQFVTYTIGYTWDPTGDMRGLGDVLDPGLADIVTQGCVGFEFVGVSCSGTLVSVHVFQGGSSQLTDFVSFAPTNLLGILETISLNANGGSAGFNAIENDDYYPEPASGVTALSGLLLLIALFRISRQFGFQRSPELGRLRHQR
jgi:hypothetical protein